MKFLEIYKSNLQAVKSGLTSLWCGEAKSDKQQGYADQLKKLIDNELFVSENNDPLVQSMERYESASDEDIEEIFKKIDKELWRCCTNGKDYNPYKHQVAAWRSLTADDCRSMVVTTGTGSGKTECFMIPLINDLKRNRILEQNIAPNEFHTIKAIFLYPLNALMEDQKERLLKLLKGTGLTFAVYNSNLPESGDGNEKKAEEIEVTSRTKLHKNGADILLTNPTMLEYMLIRSKDQVLFTENSLRWLVVDEAHTFTGAAAAELAMLFRRLLLAFGTKREELHFAASSATIGNDSDKKEQEEALQKFISDISGIDCSKIDVIAGKRVQYESADTDDLSNCKRTLSTCDYIKLSELFPLLTTTEARLAKLDELCDESRPEPQRLRAKVHFFYRVANTGIRVRLDDWADRSNGLLRLHSLTPTNCDDKTPYLELVRCEHCGEYIAIGEISDDAVGYYWASPDTDDDNLFDMNADSSKKVYFGIVRGEVFPSDGNICITVDENKYKSGDTPTDDWYIVANTNKQCPHCSAKLIPTKGNNDHNEDETDDNTQFKVSRLRISGEFISRLLAPSLLNQMQPAKRKDENGDIQIDSSKLHFGQQYISFVDSRQAAAKGTFNQNVEVEREWVFSRIYHTFLEILRYKEITSRIEELNKVIAKLEECDADEEAAKYRRELRQLKKEYPTIPDKTYLTWKDIHDLLANDPCCDQLCRQFVNQTNDEEFEDETIKDECREKYIHAIMISNLAKYPLYQACVENMGLFAPYYPKLDRITEVPEELKGLLGGIDISVKEWRNLLQIYIDRVPRSNESLYLKMETDSKVDIFNCTRRFGLKHMPHRTALKPFLKDKHCKNPSIIFYLLAKVVAPNSDNLIEVIKKNRDNFNKIADLMWNDLCNYGLLQYSEYLKKNGQWSKDKDNKKDTESIPPEQLNHEGYQLRLNVADIAFRLPEKVYYSEIKRGKKIYIRPTYTTFCGYSPYKINGNLSKPHAEESWDTYYDSKQSDINNIENWLKEHRPKMYEYGLLGDDGCFNNRVLSVLSRPTPFIQAEHTAQVDKKLSRRFQEMFKQQELNILACSTTMEMGVDLGNLELVLMSSIPPHPANYKQRAGRSGRNDSSRSACITLCSSDAVGYRILRDPMKNLINRQVAMPRVDMDCETIIQRHVNALLYRQWLTTYQTIKDNQSNALNWRIIDIFSFNYSFGEKKDNQGRNVKDIWKLKDSDNNYVYPTDENPLGDKTGSRYEDFAIWLKNNADEVMVSQILDDTPFFNQGRRFIERCSEEWEKRYNDIERELSYYGRLYKKACKENPQKVENGKVLDTKFGEKIRIQFNSIFDRRLIEYLATHRFTPNANMPVNVVELDVAHSSKRAYRDPSLPSNPSYSLRQALSQYAPGNMIVKENRVVRVAGVEYYGQESQQDKQIFHFDGTHVVGAESGPDTLIPEENRLNWPVNGKKDLELIRVKSFLPDINADDSRRITPAPYTTVNAYLVGTEDWKPAGRHLMNARANRDAGDAKILYYNDGIGYGYCLCPQCGKMELEYGIGRVKNLPEAMSVETNSCHKAIDRLGDDGQPRHCKPANGYNRNVIIGDLIQTDFCEMSLRHYSESRPLDSQSDKSLLTTLGLVICRAYTEYIGKERDSVDFIVMMNGHLCIFDTNPGGSGYANKLSNSDTRQEVLRLALDMLESIKEREELLDRFTVQHLNHIDIEETKKWIEEELATWTSIPENVENNYPEAKLSNVWNLIEQFKLAAVNGQSGVLFCDDQFEKWDYNNAWLPRIPEIARAFVTISGGVELVIPHNDVIPTEALSMLPYNGWMKISTTRQDMLTEGIHPLAYVNGRLYFTDGRWSMNGDWGRDDVFYIERKEFNVEKKAVDFSSSSNTSVFYLDDEENKKCTSTDLADIVLALAKKSGLQGLDEFIDYCSNNPAQPIKIQYVDEHLKSVAGMITILHFIEKLLTRMGRKDNFHVRFETEEYYEASSYVVADAWRNIERYERRNEILKRIVDNWLKETYHKEKAEALNMWENVCKPHNSIPHWRVLNIECGRKRLSIFPHGGIINEWRIDFSANKGHRYTAEDNTSSTLPLFREKPIMYIVKCEQL